MFRHHAVRAPTFSAQGITARKLRAGGIRRKLLTLLVLLVVVVGVLPMIVAKTPLRHFLLSMALPNDAIRVTIGDASLSWIGNPSLSGVEIKDSTGDSLLAAEAIRINRTPLNLALNTNDLGTIEIVRPFIHIKARPDGSNIEDAINKLLTKFSSGPAEPQATTSAGSTPAAIL